MERVAISFSNAWKWKVQVKSLSRVRPSATPWTAAYQAPLSMGFPRQEYWSGVPLPSPCPHTNQGKCKLCHLTDLRHWKCDSIFRYLPIQNENNNNNNGQFAELLWESKTETLKCQVDVKENASVRKWLWQRTRWGLLFNFLGFCEWKICKFSE